MKKVIYSILLIGMTAFGILYSTTGDHSTVVTENADEINPSSFPIQPPV